MTALTVAVLVFPHVELLDFAGPLEVMAESAIDSGGRCFTVSPEREVIANPSRLRVVADYLLGDAPTADVLVVPGGRGASDVQPHTDDAVAYVRGVAMKGALIASVCTGAFILARAGLLDGRHCTTHSGYRDRLQTEHPLALVEPATVVADGSSLVTAANVAGGIDLSLYLLDRLFGSDRANRVAASLNYTARLEAIVAYNVPPSGPRDSTASSG